MSGDTQITTVAERGQVQTMHPMVAASIAGNATPEIIREMMTLQREYEAGEAKKAFTRAMVAMKAELPRVLERDKTVDFTSAKGRTHYTHISLAAAVEAVTPVLTDHSFSVSWSPESTKDGVRVTCSITHADGHFEACSISAPPDNSGNKNPAQAVASTITLLQRYTLLSLLGIATKDHVEPEPKAGPVVDPKQNLKACGWIQRQGYTVEEVEEARGRRASEWTSEDLDVIRADYAKAKERPREPGQEG